MWREVEGRGVCAGETRIRNWDSRVTYPSGSKSTMLSCPAPSTMYGALLPYGVRKGPYGMGRNALSNCAPPLRVCHSVQTSRVRHVQHLVCCPVDEEDGASHTTKERCMYCVALRCGGWVASRWVLCRWVVCRWVACRWVACRWVDGSAWREMVGTETVRCGVMWDGVSWAGRWLWLRLQVWLRRWLWLWLWLEVERVACFHGCDWARFESGLQGDRVRHVQLNGNCAIRWEVR